MTVQDVGNIPVETPFDDPDTKLPSRIWVRWLARLLQRPEPFTTYTPIITASVGAFTTVAATGRYRRIGKLIFLQISITITTNGTAANAILATLPFTSVNTPAAIHILAGRGDLVSGKMIQGRVSVNSGTVLIVNYDNSYPGANGENILLTGFYEVG